MKLPHRYLFWIGGVAVIVPLVVLLVLQFRWLLSLEKTSTLAHRTSLDAFMAEVTEGVEREYGSRAEQVLRAPAAIFKGERLEEAEAHFAKAQLQGFRSAFAYRLEGRQHGTLLWFDAQTRRAVAVPDPVEQAVMTATSHLNVLNEKAVPLYTPALWVEESDHSRRMMLLPITDATSKVVGVTGVELDPGWFTSTVLPGLIATALAAHFNEEVSNNLAVTVRDAEGNRVFSTDPGEGQDDESSVSLPFVFKDWQLGVRSRAFTPAQLARTNFTINVAIASALAALLLGGIFLALHLASREVKLSQMKSDFVSNVSHELKTPLASIRLFGELMSSGRVSTPEKIKEYGELIETEGRRLTQLITNILDFSRIESGRRVYRQEPVDLGALATETLKSFEVVIRRHAVAVDYTPPAEPISIRGDADALAQVVHNLVDNAVKYSREQRRLAIEVSSRGGEAVLVVRDRGIGIPSSEQEKIFDRFHRVSTGLVHEVRGSGLGLSIVKHVVDAHRGRIEVESTVGQGSAFTLRFPLEAEAAGGVS